MNRRQHATYARLLISRCGGLVEAAGLPSCRIGKSQLAECQSPELETYMPADVIVALEAHCGERIYSQAMFEASEDAVAARDLREEAGEAIEAVADLHKEVRLATRDGRLTPAERARLAKLQASAAREVAEVGEILARDAG